MNFEKACKMLTDAGFRVTGRHTPHRCVFMNKDKTLSITVEEHIDELTAEDEKRIKERLKALGYL